MKSKRRIEWGEERDEEARKRPPTLLRLDRWLGRGSAGAMTHFPSCLSSNSKLYLGMNDFDECDQKEVARPFVVLTM
jgi:hypothetical protein